MDIHSIAEDEKLPYWSNVSVDEIPNDSSSTHEWALKQMGVVEDDAKHEIVHEMSRSRHHARDQNT